MKKFITKNKKNYIIIYTLIIILLSFILSTLFLKAIAYSASITYIPEEYQLNNNNPTELNPKNTNNNQKNIKNKLKQKTKTYVENKLKNEENSNNNLSNQEPVNQQQLNQQYTQPIVITNKDYHKFTLNIFDINKKPIYSKIEIKGNRENNNQLFTSSTLKTKLEKDDLKITITPLNENYQTLIIEGNLSKDTELNLTLFPKDFNIIFNITDLNSNKINNIDYNFIVNSLDLTKLIKKEDNKLFYNLIKNPL